MLNPKRRTLPTASSCSPPCTDIDSCTGDYVLQVDSDLLIVRHDRGHEYIAEMVDVFRTDPKSAVRALSASASRNLLPYTHEGPNWRLASRGAGLPVRPPAA